MTEAAAAAATETDTARRSSTNSAAACGTLGSLSHVCPICFNRYERADYLKRHLASREHLTFFPLSTWLLDFDSQSPADENARQHVCSRCGRRFNRKDLLTRHLANHDAEADNGSNGSEASNRTLQACDACIKSKTKCNNRRPCQRCVRRSVSCIVSSSTRSNRIQAERSGPEPQAPEPAPDLPLPYDVNVPVSSASPQAQPTVSSEPLNQIMSDLVAQSSDLSGQPPGVAASDQASSSTFHNDAMHLDISDEFFMAGMGWDSFTSPNDLFHFGRDLDFNIEPGMLEFQQLNNGPQRLSDPSHQSLSTEMPTGEMNSIAGERSQPKEKATNEQTSYRYVANANIPGYEAFKKSPWLWTPVRHDHAYAEGSQLSVNEVQVMESPEMQELSGADDMLPKMIDAATRDEMLCLVLKFSSSNVRIRSFPSFRLLNILMQAFFVKENASVTPWLHTATFDPDSVRGELLAGIVAAGATLFAVPNIWKMGLALQEIVKLATAAAIDEDNRRVRELHSIQAFWLWIKIGLWSGFRRKMEIAEGFANTVPTMLRGSGAFRQSKYTPAIVPTENDTDEELKQKWLRWVEQESFKRFALQVMMNEMRRSIAFNRTPVISGTEITFSLPAAQACWEAQNEREWRRNLLSRTHMSATVTLMDAMHDPSSLDKQADIIDVGFCSHAILLGLWGRVCSFVESKTFHLGDNSDSHSSSSLWLEAQRQGLYEKVQMVSTKLGWMLPLSSEARLISEFLMMSLHISAEDILRTAGRYGENEFQNSLPRLRQWNASKEGRYAKWHAGQVLRAARSFPPTQLDSFNAIATYQACLVLWVSCALNQGSPNQTKANSITQPTTFADCLNQGNTSAGAPVTEAQRGLSSTRQSATQVPKIRIDGEETPEARIYLSMGVGKPCLQVADEVVGLENPLAMSTALSEIFKSNFPSETHCLPPMLENLDGLMSELSRTHHF